MAHTFLFLVRFLSWPETFYYINHCILTEQTQCEEGTLQTVDTHGTKSAPYVIYVHRGNYGRSAGDLVRFTQTLLTLQCHIGSENSKSRAICYKRCWLWKATNSKAIIATASGEVRNLTQKVFVLERKNHRRPSETDLGSIKSGVSSPQIFRSLAYLPKSTQIKNLSSPWKASNGNQ